MKHLFTGILLMVLVCPSYAAPNTAKEPFYHEVPARPGDGIFSLLRRYELHEPSCNINEFLSLNELEMNDVLIAGKEYILPVLIHEYNGRSIRSTLNMDDYEKAKWVQDYNLRLLQNGLRQTDFRQSRILWVPYSVLNCEEEKSDSRNASRVSGRHFSIFGEKYSYTPLIDESLRGKVFYIVSGHGGPDPGAHGKRAGNRLCEDEYAYDVALRLARNLVERGATAYMITRDENDGIRDELYLECDTDETVWGGAAMPLGQVERLSQRARIINDLYKKHKDQGVTYQRTVIIHVDSRSANKRADLFFYHHPESEEGKKLARNLHQTIKEKYEVHRHDGRYTGTISPRNLFMLRETVAPSVYIELGNIRNAADQRRFVLESNREALANWLFDGLFTEALQF